MFEGTRSLPPIMGLRSPGNYGIDVNIEHQFQDLKNTQFAHASNMTFFFLNLVRTQWKVVIVLGLISMSISHPVVGNYIHALDFEINIIPKSNAKPIELLLLNYIHLPIILRLIFCKINTSGHTKPFRIEFNSYFNT